MEHLRVAGLVAGAVIEEILHLLLALRLAFQPAGVVEALRARHRGNDAVRSASCCAARPMIWLPDCAAWSAPLADWLEDISALICVCAFWRFCTTPAWTCIESW